MKYHSLLRCGVIVSQPVKGDIDITASLSMVIWLLERCFAVVPSDLLLGR